MNKLLFTFLTFAIFSCNTSKVSKKLDQDNLEIYNLSLSKTTGSDSIVRYYFRIPPSPLQQYGNKISKIELEKHKQWRDSLKLIMDTIQLFVVINHQIDTLHSSDVQDVLKTITTNKSNLEYKMKGDTSFNESIKELCNNKLFYDTIDVSNFKTQFNYKIYSDRDFPNDKFRQIGTVSFSKVAYSYNKTKAAVYTSFVCGGECGIGQILFFAKVNGKWEYIKTWEMWIS